MRYLIIFVLGLSFMACRKDTYCIKSVENRAERTVYVNIYRTIINTENLAFEVQPGETYVFRQDSERGLNEALPDCSDGIDSLRVAIRDEFGNNYFANIRWWEDRGWERTKAQPKSFVEHTCNLVVKDQQFNLPF